MCFSPVFEIYNLMRLLAALFGPGCSKISAEAERFPVAPALSQAVGNDEEGLCIYRHARVACSDFNILHVVVPAVLETGTPVAHAIPFAEHSSSGNRWGRRQIPVFVADLGRLGQVIGIEHPV